MEKKYSIIETLPNQRRLWAKSVTRKQAARILIELRVRFPGRNFQVEVK